MNAVEDINSHIYIANEEKRRKQRRFCKVEEFEKLKNFKTEEKLKLKIFNFLWWRDPPYKNDDFRHRVQFVIGF